MTRRKVQNLQIEQDLRPAASPVAGYNTPRVPRSPDRLASLAPLSRALTDAFIAKGREDKKTQIRQDQNAGTETFNDLAVEISGGAQAALTGSPDAWGKAVEQQGLHPLATPFAQANYDKRVGTKIFSEGRRFMDSKLEEWTQVGEGDVDDVMAQVQNNMAQVRGDLLKDNPLLATDFASGAFEESWAAYQDVYLQKAGEMIADRHKQVWQNATSVTYTEGLRDVVDLVNDGRDQEAAQRIAETFQVAEEDLSENNLVSLDLLVGSLEATLGDLAVNGDDGELAGDILDLAKDTLFGGKKLGDRPEYLKQLAEMEAQYEAIRGSFFDTQAKRLASEKVIVLGEYQDETYNRLVQMGNEGDDAGRMNGWIELQWSANKDDPFRDEKRELGRQLIQTVLSPKPESAQLKAEYDLALVQGTLSAEQVIDSIGHGLNSSSAASYLQQLQDQSSSPGERQGFAPHDSVITTIGRAEEYVDGYGGGISEDAKTLRDDMVGQFNERWSEILRESRNTAVVPAERRYSWLQEQAAALSTQFETSIDARFGNIRQEREDTLRVIDDLRLRGQDYMTQLRDAQAKDLIGDDTFNEYAGAQAGVRDNQRWTNTRESNLDYGQIVGMIQSSPQVEALGGVGDPNYTAPMAQALVDASLSRYRSDESDMIDEVRRTMDPGQWNKAITDGRAQLIEKYRKEFAGQEAVDIAGTTGTDTLDPSDKAVLDQGAAERKQRNLKGFGDYITQRNAMHGGAGIPEHSPASPLLQDLGRNSISVWWSGGPDPLNFYGKLNDHTSGKASVSFSDVASSQEAVYRDLISDSPAGEPLSPEVTDALVEMKIDFGLGLDHIMSGTISYGQGAHVIAFDPTTVNPYTTSFFRSPAALEAAQKDPTEFQAALEIMGADLEDFSRIMHMQKMMQEDYLRIRYGSTKQD